jgi:hypothetical protein
MSTEIIPFKKTPITEIGGFIAVIAAPQRLLVLPMGTGLGRRPAGRRRHRGAARRAAGAAMNLETSTRLRGAAIGAERNRRRRQDLAIAVDIIVRSVSPIDDLIAALESAGGSVRLVGALRRELAAWRGERR